jgi:cyclopropane fatty-acyl-phospholipid synthase-like methyltransferase
MSNGKLAAIRAMDDLRRFAAATSRNREPILAVLQRVLPEHGRLLEIASGSGEHAVYFAAALPGLHWQPTDLDPDALASISAWRDHANLTNLLAPLPLDVHDERWSIPPVDAVFCANMIHIAPWSATAGMLRVVGRTLRSGGTMVLYGPFRVGGQHTAQSNVAFDARLRTTDASWGVRDLEAVLALAEPEGLRLREQVTMPANNLSIVLDRA